MACGSIRWRWTNQGLEPGFREVMYERALVPWGPAEAVGVVVAVVDGGMQIVHVELVLWLATAGIAAADPKLCSHCSVMKRFAGSGLSVVFFESPQVGRVNPAVGAFDGFFEDLFFGGECFWWWSFQLGDVGEDG